MKLVDVTLATLELNAILDSGKLDGYSVGDAKEHIENLTVFKYLTDCGFPCSSISIETKAALCEGWRRMYDGYGGDELRRWGVENKGLCLLLAWTNEILQLGGVGLGEGGDPLFLGVIVKENGRYYATPHGLVYSVLTKAGVEKEKANELMCEWRDEMRRHGWGCFRDTVQLVLTEMEGEVGNE